MSLRDGIPDLNIFPGQTSKRLFFAKATLGDTVWHILDFAISQVNGTGANQKTYSMALHREWVCPAIYADTVEEMAEKSVGYETLCTGCLEAFDYAKEIIKERKLLSFGKPRIILP